MKIGKIKEVYPGGNTSLGFFSYYDYILSQEEATRIIVIKGGPGVGKSTFMKKIGMEMVERGYDVEFLHCSSDNDSLDGIVISKLKIALVDGTAPHIVDPKNPGAVDEIIHLGDYWNEAGMRENRESIIECNKEVGRLFRRAYRYLDAAKKVDEDTAAVYASSIDNQKVSAKTEILIDEIFAKEKIAPVAGRQRNSFASAITPEGLKNYLPTLLDGSRIFVLKGQHGTGTEKLLVKIGEAAIERGYNIESYFCSLNPHKVEHLLIPEKGISFTTSNKYHEAGVEAHQEINLDEFLEHSLIDKNHQALADNESLFEELMNKAVEAISQAKAVHDKMETYYIPYMDFAAVQDCMETTLARILNYAS